MLQELPDSLNEYANVKKVNLWKRSKKSPQRQQHRKGKRLRSMLLCALRLGLIHPNAEYHGCGRVNQAVDSLIDGNKFTKNCLGLL